MEKEKLDFDVKKALDNAKFLSFLAKSPDYDKLVMTDSEVIFSKFERFEKKELLLNKYKEIFSVKIKDETTGENKAGIVLTEDDFASVNEFFEDIALNDSERFSKIEKTITDFETLPTVIKNLEDGIKEKGTPTSLEEKREEVVKEKYVVGLTSENVGIQRVDRFLDNVFKRKTPKYKNQAIARESFGNKYGLDRLTTDGVENISKVLDRNIATIDETISEVKVLEDSLKHAEQALAGIRGELFEGMKSFSSIIKTIKDKLEQQIVQLKEKKTFKEQEIAGKRVEEIKKVNETGEILGGKLDKDNINQDQSEIDKKIEDFVIEEVSTAINGLSLGNGAYSRLEKSLKDVLSKETLGSKNQEETKIFISDTLSNSIDEVIDTNTDEGKQKRLMILHIISTI